MGTKEDALPTVMLTPSLAIRETPEGKLLFHCHAGCSQKDVLDALRDQELWPPASGKSEAKPTPQIMKTYDYVNECGQLLYQQVRFEPKEFKPRRPDPRNPGRFVWSLKNNDGTCAVRLVPYRLPELIESHEVYITEGEKDADTLHSHGFCATTNAFGAANWRDEFNPLFEGKRVIIIPDNDEAGWRRAMRIAIGVSRYASELSILELDRDAKDITEWFERGHSAEELAVLVGGGRTIE